MGDGSRISADQFAATFAPDRDRPAAPRTDLRWLGGGLCLLLAGTVIATTGVLSALGDLPRNPYVGIRTVDTLRSDTTWRTAHRAAAIPLLLSALPLLTAGARLLRRRPANPGVTTIVAAVAAFGALVLVATFVATDAVR